MASPPHSCAPVPLLLALAGPPPVAAPPPVAKIDKQASQHIHHDGYCGDGIRQPSFEQCDDGDLDDTDACTSLCQTAVCGDGLVHVGAETCDDANVDDTDACPRNCQFATCGDGFLQLGVEVCDDHNTVDTDACPSTCQRATCGDGFVQAGVEECDDRDDDDHDGCTSSCHVVRIEDFEARRLVPRWRTFGDVTWQIGSAANPFNHFAEVYVATRGIDFRTQIATLEIDVIVPTRRTVSFRRQIAGKALGDDVRLTWSIDGGPREHELRVDDEHAFVTHSFRLSAGKHTISWTAIALAGSALVRIDDVQIGP